MHQSQAPVSTTQQAVVAFPLTKQQTEKKYFQLLMPGHYCDVMSAQDQWRLAKVIDKDKRYIYVTFDGQSNKEQQPYFINSNRVAPLRLHTEGFVHSGQVVLNANGKANLTSSGMMSSSSGSGRILRYNMPKASTLPNYLQIANTKFFEPEANPFQITQLLRGQLFVLIHDLLFKQYNQIIDYQLSSSEQKQVNSFLYAFLDFVLKTLQKVKDFSEQYFQLISTSINQHKLSYLNDPRIALTNSLQELLHILCLIIKIQPFQQANGLASLFAKYSNQGGSKSSPNFYIDSQEMLAKYFFQRNGVELLYQLFCLNNIDNGKWMPSTVRRLIYRILIRYAFNYSVGKSNSQTKPMPFNYAMPKLPEYQARDFYQFYSIYPLMIELAAKNGAASPKKPNLTSQNFLKLESTFIQYSISTLLQGNSPFDAKLRALQQVKAILFSTLSSSDSSPVPLQIVPSKYISKAKLIKQLTDRRVLEQLLNPDSFNPQIFKRFVPILSSLFNFNSKTSSKEPSSAMMNFKHINALFQIIKHRHESEHQMIFSIISQITQFAPSSTLDNIYSEICKININCEQTIQFVKRFTLKAAQNLSKEKTSSSTSSYIGSFFGKKPKISSSQYGYYGLVLLYKQILAPQGRIQSEEKIIFTLKIIQQLLANQMFHSERQSYISKCIAQIYKNKAGDIHSTFQADKQIYRKKSKNNLAQSIKLINLIILTYVDYSMILGDDKKKIIEKLMSPGCGGLISEKEFLTSFNLIELIVEAFKEQDKAYFQRKYIEKGRKLMKQQIEIQNCQPRISYQNCVRYFYELVELFCLHVKNPLKLRQIQYLWLKSPFNNLLLDFLKRPRPVSNDSQSSQQPNPKLISSETIEQIFKQIFHKPSFYKRPSTLTIYEFQAVYDIFINYHQEKQNIEKSKLKGGLLRYYKSNLLGFEYFMKFLINFRQQGNSDKMFQKAAKKTIQVLLRPKLESVTPSQKATVWKNLFTNFILFLSQETSENQQSFLSSLQPRKILLWINIFLTEIEGRFQKQIYLNDASPSLSILVQCQNQEKYISLEKYATIFKLRKLIKQKFQIKTNFKLFNVKLNKVIDNQEEQDYSVFAMPLMGIQASIIVKVLQRQKQHPHQQALKKFRLLVQSDENIYQIIFKIGQQHTAFQNISKEQSLLANYSRFSSKLFWQTINKLPINRSMLVDIEDLSKFSHQKWENYLESNGSSEYTQKYKLNIIQKIIDQANNDQWVEDLSKSGGLDVLTKNIINQLKTMKKARNQDKQLNQSRNTEYQEETEQESVINQSQQKGVSNDTLIEKLLDIVLRINQIIGANGLKNNRNIISKKDNENSGYQMSLEQQNRQIVDALSKDKSVLQDLTQAGLNKLLEFYSHNHKIILKQLNSNKKSKSQKEIIDPETILPVNTYLEIFDRYLLTESSPEIYGQGDSSAIQKFFKEVSISMTFVLYGNDSQQLIGEVQSQKRQALAAKHGQILQHLLQRWLHVGRLSEIKKGSGCAHFFEYLITMLYAYQEDHHDNKIQKEKTDKSQKDKKQQQSLIQPQTTQQTETSVSVSISDSCSVSASDKDSLSKTKIFSQESYYPKIMDFVKSVFYNDCKQTQQIHQQSVLKKKSLSSQQNNMQYLINGALTLFKYLLAKKYQTVNRVNSQLLNRLVDEKQMFSIILDQLLFPSKPEGLIKVQDKQKTTSAAEQENKALIQCHTAFPVNEKNKKLIFQILKKLVFHIPILTQKLIEKLSPFMQQYKYRRQSPAIISNWSLSWQRNLSKNKIRSSSNSSKFVGLRNLGATCYMNSLFQQLFTIRQFRDNFLQIDSRKYRLQTAEESNKVSTFQLSQNQIYHLQQIFFSLKYSQQRSISCQQFCQSFITYEGTAINPTIQSDCDQFFNQLMEKIQSFLTYTQNHNILENTFQGKLSNQLNCQGCPHSSEKIDPFMSIGLNLKNKKTLNEALKGYVEGEILDGNNAYYCSECEKKVRTVKRLCIKELPNILVIVLKRFEYNYDEMRKIKINSYLQFPEELDMSEYTSDFEPELKEQKQLKSSCKNKNNLFQLRGCVIHSGTSQAGHYYSFIKDMDSNKDMYQSSEGLSKKKAIWYQFNDDCVSEINSSKIKEDGYGGGDEPAASSSMLDSKANSSHEQEFLSMTKMMERYKNAYMLFYQRKQQQHISLQQKQQSQQQKDKKQSKGFGNIEQNEQNTHQQQPQKQSNPVQKPKQTLIPSELSAYHEQMRSNKLRQNYQANVMSIMFEVSFIRFCQNLSMLDQVFLGGQKSIVVKSSSVAGQIEEGQGQRKMQQPNTEQDLNVFNSTFQAKKLIMLYYHTVILRHKERSEYVNSFFRIVMGYLAQEGRKVKLTQKNTSSNTTTSMALWFLEQVGCSVYGERYIQQFLIQAPKSIRYICVTMILKALGTLRRLLLQQSFKQQQVEGKVQPKNSEESQNTSGNDSNQIKTVINNKLIPTLMKSIRKSGMMPFAKIFVELAKIKPFREQLARLRYPEIICKLLIKGQLEQFSLNEHIKIQGDKSTINCSTNQSTQLSKTVPKATCFFYPSQHNSNTLLQPFVQQAKQKISAALLESLMYFFIRNGLSNLQQVCSLSNSLQSQLPLSQQQLQQQTNSKNIAKRIYDQVIGITQLKTNPNPNPNPIPKQTSSSPSSSYCYEQAQDYFNQISTPNSCQRQQFAILSKLNEMFSFRQANRLIAQRMVQIFIKGYNPNPKNMQKSIEYVAIRWLIRMFQHKIILSNYSRDFLDKWLCMLRAIYRRCEKLQKQNLETKGKCITESKDNIDKAKKNNRSDQKGEISHNGPNPNLQQIQAKPQQQQEDGPFIQSYMEFVLTSLAMFFTNARKTLDPMLYVLRTMSQFAYRDKIFRQAWKIYLQKQHILQDTYYFPSSPFFLNYRPQEPSYSPRNEQTRAKAKINSVLYWYFQQISQPQLLQLNDNQYKAKIAQMKLLQQKLDFGKELYNQIYFQTRWMYFTKEQKKKKSYSIQAATDEGRPAFKGLEDLYEVDPDDSSSLVVCVRNRKVRVRQIFAKLNPSNLPQQQHKKQPKQQNKLEQQQAIYHQQQLLYLLTPGNYNQKHDKWAYIEKNELQFFNNL